MRRNSGRSCAPPAGGGVLESGPRTPPGRPKHLRRDGQHFQQWSDSPTRPSHSVRQDESGDRLAPLTNNSPVKVIRQHPFTDGHQQPESFLFFSVEKENRRQDVHGLHRESHHEIIKQTTQLLSAGGQGGRGHSEGKLFFSISPYS